MEISSEGYTKAGAPPFPGAPGLESTPKRSTWLGSSSSTTSSAAAAAAASVGSPQRMQSSHTIEEIRARLRPRVQSGKGLGFRVALAVAAALLLSPFPARFSPLLPRP